MFPHPTLCGIPHHMMRVLPLKFCPLKPNTVHMAAHQTSHLDQAHATPVHVLLAPGKDAHARQVDLVRASLIACPAASRPTHRRWA
jgi:hypothetical protein